MELIAGLKVHPAASLFPLIEDDAENGKAEFALLVEDMRIHGQRDPVTLWSHDGDQFVLDGRNRLRACEELGIEPKYDFYTGDDPVGFIISANLRRRHLGTSQRAMIAARMAELPATTETATATESNELHAESLNLGLTVEEAAEAMNVSEAQVDAAKRVRRSSKALAEKVAKGQMTVHKASKILAKRAKRKAGVTGEVSQRQEDWSSIVAATKRLFKALNAALVIDLDGKPSEDARYLGGLIKDGRGITAKPEVFASTLDAVRRGVGVLAPLCREAYQKKEK